MNDISPQELANKVLNEIKEKTKEISFPIDPYKLLSDANVIIKMSDFEGLEGIILRDEDGIVAVGINNNRPFTRQRFTAAHEYCHFIKDLGKENYNQIRCIESDDSPIEKYADEFAANLLMPKEEIICKFNLYKNDSKEISLDDILFISEYFGVSFTACLIRLSELKLCYQDYSRDELKALVAEYHPYLKRIDLVKNTNDLKLVAQMINSLTYNMISLNKITGIKFLNKYIYNDNRIERIDVPKKEVNMILTDLRVNGIDSKYFDLDDENIIFTMGNYKMQEFVLTTNDEITILSAKKLHEKLNEFMPYPEYSGSYRNSNSLVTKGNFQPISYELIEDEMNSLNKLYTEYIKVSDRDSIHEYIYNICKFIYRFIVIHPFTDGNGRISRALMNYMLRQKNLPPIYIDEGSREEYHKALKMIDTYDDYSNFVILIEKRIINTMIELHQYLFLN